MTTTLTLPAEMNIYGVATLRAEWLAWLDAHGREEGAVALDGAQVAEVDAAALQCMLAFERSLARLDRRLQLVRASDVLRRACATLGVAHVLVDGPTAAGDPA